MRDYKKVIGTYVMGNDGFTVARFEDGYADLENDSTNILMQLYNTCAQDNLIEYISNYLNGYEVGSFMSENAHTIYDEDGCLKEDEYDIEPSEFNIRRAEYLVKSYR